MKRLEFIVKEGDLLNSIQGRILSWAAKLKVLTLGSLNVDRDHFEKPLLSISNMRSYDLLNKKGLEQKTDPELFMDVTFYPAGMLVIEILEGKDLRTTEWLGKSDNYVEMKARSKAKGDQCNIVRKTEVKKGGGSNCNFDSEFSIDVCDCDEVEICVWDDDIGKDDLIGSCKIDLLDVYRKGVVDQFYQLKYWKKLGFTGCGGKKIEQAAGEIRIRMSFFAGSISGIYDDVLYPVQVDLPEGEVR